MDLAEIFTQIYRSSAWVEKGTSSKSGFGSTLEMTFFVRAGLEKIIQDFRPASFLDLPCGESDWLRPVVDVHSFHYTGADIVLDVIERNQRQWPQYEWLVLDICASPLPMVDMIFCRDCFVHFPLEFIFKALGNIRSSGSKYLVMTTFPQITEGNGEIVAGKWRRLDFTQEPFKLPEPLLLVNECGDYPSKAGDKSLGVWGLDQLHDLKDTMTQI